jgi:hypothetical protein
VRRGESDDETEELASVRFVPLVEGLPRTGGETKDDAALSQDDLVHDESGVE